MGGGEAFAAEERGLSPIPPSCRSRARIQQLQMADALKTGRAVSDYPSTDMQFADRERLGIMGPDDDDEGQYDEGQYTGTNEAQYHDDASAASAGTSAPPPKVLLQQGVTGQYTPEEYALYCEQYYAWYGVDPPDALPPQSEAPTTAAVAPQGSEKAEEESGDAALALIACYGSDSD